MTERFPLRRAGVAATPLGRLARAGGGSTVAAIALPLLSGLLLLVQAGLLAHVLHAGIVDGAPLETLATPLALLAATLLVRIGLGVFGEIFAVRASESAKLMLRRALVGTLLARPPVWSAARPSGALAGAVVEQVEALDGYLARYLPATVQATLLPLAFAAVIFPVDVVVGLLFLFTAPLIPLFMALAGWGAEAASRRQAAALGRLSGYFADRLRGLTTLRLFGREAAETANAAAASHDLRRRTMGVMRIAFLSSAVLEFFAALGVAGVALYVGLTFLDLVALRGTPLTLQAGLFCLLMAPEVYQPLRLMAAHYHDRASARAAMAEIAATYGEVPLSVPAPRDTSADAGATGAIALGLDAVTVTAPDGRIVLRDIALALGAGEHVAILGASGSGKSTLLEAIAGLRPANGRITLDGVALAEIGEGELRRRVGVVGQRPTIFAGSIADNIRLGRRGACHAALRLAARRAHVADFAADLPHGLETLLGEDGIGLSGGEVHRVALARLYLREPGLLLLDEPTAHLDAVTEAAVLDDLLAFAQGRTMLVVTHSEAVAARMQRCYRIVEGRLLPAPRPRLQLPAARSAA